MDVLKEIGKSLSYVGKSLSGAVDSMVEKNRRKAMVNRVRVVIKSERDNTARAYAALGKYYFENLRDPQNTGTEPLCHAVEEGETRLKRAFDKLEDLREEFAKSDEESICEGCELQNCEDCDYYCNEDAPYAEAEPFDEEEEPASPEEIVDNAPHSAEEEAAPDPAPAEEPKA